MKKRAFIGVLSLFIFASCSLPAINEGSYKAAQTRVQEFYRMKNAKQTDSLIAMFVKDGLPVVICCQSEGKFRFELCMEWCGGFF